MRFLNRSPRDRATTVFYATDVHGSERTWRKFLNAAAFYKADVLVMGGDVMGKLVIPIIREAGGAPSGDHPRSRGAPGDILADVEMRADASPTSASTTPWWTRSLPRHPR